MRDIRICQAVPAGDIEVTEDGRARVMRNTEQLLAYIEGTFGVSFPESHAAATRRADETEELLSQIRRTVQG